jgi:NADH-quinone oxidoreductase subunit H
MPQPSWFTGQLVVSAVLLFTVVHVILGLVGYATYAERKISAYAQDRLGPNRVGFDLGLPFLKKLFTFRGKLFGFWGLAQPLADGLKFFFKEDYQSPHVDKALFTLAPMVAVIPALIGFAVIPWGGMWNMPEITIPGLGWTIGGEPVHVTGAPVSVGIVYLLAVAALGVYGVTLGGWAGNNKFSFLGGLRATAQMLAYEIPLGLSLLCLLLVVGSVLPDQIIRHQADHGWMLLAMPIPAVLCFVAMLAEANRAPFDNAEAEQELVGGFHTEYSSMRFALFFLAEYAHVVTSAAFFTLLFLGGYHLPLVLDGHLLHPDNASILGVLAKIHVFFGKVLLLVGFVMLVRWTLPRIRYDQVMMMAWQGFIPVSLIAVVVISVMVYFGRTSTLELLGANLLLGLGLLIVQPLIPKTMTNKQIPLYGSRFRPMPGEVVVTRPTNPQALEDRPIQGAMPAR